jgi:CheY-like chemotaxis protein
MGKDTKKILIVDDEREFLLLLGKMVRSKGYQVLAANTGKDAIDIAREQKPDVIIMDIMMPDMDGRLAGKVLREHESTKNIPIIYLTGLLSSEEEEKAGHHVSGSYIFSKPCKMDELFEIIERLAAGEKPPS